MKRLLPLLMLCALLMGQDNCEPQTPPAPGPGDDPYCYGTPTVWKSATDIASSAWAIMRGEESTDRRATLRVGSESGYCSGVAIGPHTFLTAAHCTFGKTRIAAALNTAGVPPYWDATLAIEHPEYRRYKSSGNQYAAGRYYDVSVVQVGNDREGEIGGLPEPHITGFFDPTDPEDAGHCIGFLAQGWGKAEDPKLALRETEYHIDTVTDTSVSTVIGPEDGAICFGDSGGPLYAEMDDGSLKIVGVTSTTASTDCLVGSTHARVSPLSGWIWANE